MAFKLGVTLYGERRFSTKILEGGVIEMTIEQTAVLAFPSRHSMVEASHHREIVLTGGEVVCLDCHIDSRSMMIVNL